METKIEQNKGFWAAALGPDRLRSRVAASFIQQYAYCTFQNNNASSTSSPASFSGTASASSMNNAISNGKPSLSPSNEPFESSSPLAGRNAAKSSSSSTTAALLSSSNAKPGIPQILSTWRAISNLATSSSSSASAAAVHLPPPRLYTAAQRKQLLLQQKESNNNSRNSPNPQQQPKSGSQSVAATSPGHTATTTAGNVNSNNNLLAHAASSSHITPPYTGKNNNLISQQDRDNANSLQTPRNEDFTATSGGKSWRSHLITAERVFGHAVSTRLPLQNRGSSACRAAALGETWSAFLDAKGHVRLCGSGAQSLNCKPSHKFTSIAWVGDFIAMVDERQDLYVARVSGSSSGLRSSHVLPAFIAPEGQPQKLMENVAEVSGTAAGLLVLNLNGEVFFYSVQKPRQAPLGGIVPYRSSSTVLLSPQLDIFVLDGLTKMLHKCSIQQHQGRPNTPRAIVSLRVQIKALSAGHRFLCCIDSNGALWVMGWNEVGQLGLTGTDHVRAFVMHEQMTKTAYLTDVACGKRHSCVLSIDGCVYVSGSNKHGQIGITVPTSTGTKDGGQGNNNNNQPSSSSNAASNNTGGKSSSSATKTHHHSDPGFPIARRFFRVPLREKCVAIACGPNASMFAMESFRVFVCGNNEFGQLGLDPCLSINPGQVPVCVASFGLFGVSQVSEFVKFTDASYVCSGAGHGFDPNDASTSGMILNVGGDGGGQGGGTIANRRKTGGGSGGGCCGGGDDSNNAEGGGGGEDGVSRGSTALCGCVMQ